MVETQSLHFDTGEIPLDGNGNRTRKDPVAGLPTKAARQAGRLLPIPVGNIDEETGNARHVQRLDTSRRIFMSMRIDMDRSGQGANGRF